MKKRRGEDESKEEEGQANQHKNDSEVKTREEGMKAKKKRGGQSKQRCDSPVKKRRGGDESKEEEGRAKQTKEWQPSHEMKRRG